MSTSDPTVAPLSLWLTDRSRYESGVEHCKRDRYLSYHAGPHGYGWARKAQSIPTVTGTLVHGPLAVILAEVQRTDAIPADEFIYHEAIVKAGLVPYHRIVETRGLRLTQDEKDLAHRVAEQTTLLEGLVWAWVRERLPAFHVEHRILLVESEELSIIGCTCGLGDRIGTAEQHDARGCLGIAWQTRGDAIAERREPPHTKKYVDFKTTAAPSMNWEEQWKYRVQLIAGVLGAEQRLECVIDEVDLEVLYKGKNEREWDPDQGAAVGPKYQNSPLVYGWRRPGNPPLTPEEWAATYNYLDDFGKRHRLTKDFKRTGLWTLDPAYWQQGMAQGPCLSASDYWTRWIQPSGTLGMTVKKLGPFYRREWQLQSFLTQLTAEERRWQEILWTLHDLGQTHGWATPEFQAKLDELVPQSRGSACHNFYGDTCPHVRICDRDEGWQDPALQGMIPRRPHHAAELEQAIGRGLLPEAYGAEEYPED